MDHAGPLAGNVLRFTSILSRVVPELEFRYGESLIEFTPRLTKVGEILAVTARTWVPDAKLELTITAAWDWDKQALSVTVVPSMGLPASSEKAPASGEAPQADASDSGPSWSLVDEAVDFSTAPRVILGKLLPKLNERLTGTATVVGEPGLRPGMVVTLDGVGQQFGGAYRVTSVTHTLDGGGFRTSFDVRKEVWFDGAHLLRGLKGALAAATPPGQLQQLTGVS